RLLYGLGALVGVLVVALALYRLGATPKGFGEQWLGRFIDKRVALSPDSADPWEAHLAALIRAIRLGFALLGIAVAFATVFWLLAWNEGCRRSKTQLHFAKVKPAVDVALTATLLQIGLWVLLVPALGLLALNRLAPAQVADNNPLFKRV